jgi:hypothetical protein
VFPKETVKRVRGAGSSVDPHQGGTRFFMIGLVGVIS